MSTWRCAVTTVYQRSQTLLPRTLESLYKAGFEKEKLHLFVDGNGLVRNRTPSYTALVEFYATQFREHPLTVRASAVRCHGAWLLALMETFLRDNTAQYYAVFQDDFVCYRNLRSYLEQNGWPEKGYANLYTYTATNEPIIQGKPVGTWHEAGLTNPAPPEGLNVHRWQAGRGAVALVFRRQAAYDLLASSKMVEHSMDGNRGWRKTDGAIVNTMNQAGYREYVHCPSLVQHTGEVSTTESLPLKFAQTFLGEQVDALSFLGK